MVLDSGICLQWSLGWWLFLDATKLWPGPELGSIGPVPLNMEPLIWEFWWLGSYCDPIFRFHCACSALCALILVTVSTLMGNPSTGLNCAGGQTDQPLSSASKSIHDPILGYTFNTSVFPFVLLMFLLICDSYISFVIYLSWTQDSKDDCALSLWVLLHIYSWSIKVYRTWPEFCFRLTPVAMAVL